MNETSIKEIKEMTGELKLQADPYIGVYFHDTTPELLAAIKNKEGFKKYLSQ